MINGKHKNKPTVFKVFIKHHSKLYIYTVSPKPRKPSTIKVQTAYISMSMLMVGFRIMTEEILLKHYDQRNSFIYNSCSI